MFPSPPDSTDHARPNSGQPSAPAAGPRLVWSNPNPPFVDHFIVDRPIPFLRLVTRMA